MPVYRCECDYRYHRFKKGVLYAFELELQVGGSLQSRCWELNLGPLNSHLQELLTFEPSLQPFSLQFHIYVP